MLWPHHLFALFVLAHMLWAAVLLEREWRRIRSTDGAARERRQEDMRYVLTNAEAPQANSGK
jgi:hypothetical protein